MMNDDTESETLDKARHSLDQSVETMPDGLSAALASARARAIASAETPALEDAQSTVVRLKAPIRRNGMVWGSALAASCAALALIVVLRQPGTEELLPLDTGDAFALEAEEAMLILAEMDEQEWDLVQELEFALWLTEFGDEASATDFSG